MEKYLGGGCAFSSKLIQLCLNTIHNSEFRYNWGVQKPLGGGGGWCATHLWGQIS